MKFQTNGKFLAQVWDSGRIVIYDIASASVKSEYIPESHLQCAATCVRWEGDNLLLIGAQDGTVIIFDALEQKVKSFLKKVHADQVEDIISAKNKVFSCGHDGSIHEYHLKRRSRLQWDQIEQSNPLYSLCLFKNGSQLLAASVSQLRVFDVDNRQLVKVVGTQHVSPVRFLIATEDNKLLSGAERHIVVWNKKLNCEETHILGSSDIKSLHSLNSSIAAVSASGECVIFDQETKKKVVIQISTSETDLVEIHEARLIDDAASAILIYGPTSHPKIEKLRLPSKNQIYIRKINEVKAKSAPEHGVPVTQYKADEAKIIGPLNERVEKPINSVRDSDDPDQVPFEERLLDSHSDSGKGEELDDQPVSNPRTDNMVHLLLQGLQSGDKAMLNAVIFRNDRKVIKNTLRRLPFDAVPLFVKELVSRLHCRPSHIVSTTRWAQELLLQHYSYLNSCPQILGPLMVALHSRLISADRVSEVKSRLDTLLASRRPPKIDVSSAELSVSEDDDTLDSDVSVFDSSSERDDDDDDEEDEEEDDERNNDDSHEDDDEDENMEVDK